MTLFTRFELAVRKLRRPRALVAAALPLAVLALSFGPAPVLAVSRFTAPLPFGTGNGPHSVAIGDLNGDGSLDLAVANEYSNSISVLLGNADGTFGAK